MSVLSRLERAKPLLLAATLLSVAGLSGRSKL